MSRWTCWPLLRLSPPKKKWSSGFMGWGMSGISRLLNSRTLYHWTCGRQQGNRLLPNFECLSICDECSAFGMNSRISNLKMGVAVKSSTPGLVGTLATNEEINHPQHHLDKQTPQTNCQHVSVLRGCAWLSWQHEFNYAGIYILYRLIDQNHSTPT